MVPKYKDPRKSKDQTLPIGRIGNSCSMDHPDHSLFGLGLLRKTALKSRLRSSLNSQGIMTGMRHARLTGCFPYLLLQHSCGLQCISGFEKLVHGQLWTTMSSPVGFQEASILSFWRLGSHCNFIQMRYDKSC